MTVNVSPSFNYGTILFICACFQNSLHTTYECEIFRNANVPAPNFPGAYDVVLVLRCALMLENSNHDELIWQSYLDWNSYKVNSANEKNIRSVPEHLQSMTEEFLLKICRLTFTFERTNSAEFIQQVLSYVHANSVCQENRASAFDSNNIRNYHRLVQRMHLRSLCCRIFKHIHV